MHARAVWLTLFLVCLLLIPMGSAKEVEVHLVSTGDSGAPYAFEPREVTLAQGDSIRWINDESVFHTATSTDSLSAKRSNGDWSHTLGSQGSEATQAFDQAGTFFYFCQPHASFMDGVIRVMGTGGAGGAGQDEDTPVSVAPWLAGLIVAALAVAVKRRA